MILYTCKLNINKNYVVMCNTSYMMYALLCRRYHDKLLLKITLKKLILSSFVPKITMFFLRIFFIRRPPENNRSTGSGKKQIWSKMENRQGSYSGTSFLDHGIVEEK